MQEKQTESCQAGSDFRLGKTLKGHTWQAANILLLNLVETMLRSADAIADEPTLRPIPTTAELGRPLKTAHRLNSCPDTQMVTDAVTGARFNPGDNEGNQALIAAMGVAINAACAPGGVIHSAIQNSINAACRPRGAIQNAFDAMEKRSLARQHNGHVHEANASLQALPDRNNVVPDNFPETYEDFETMSADTATGLMQAYGLEPARNVRRNRKLLSALCNVNLPR